MKTTSFLTALRAHGNLPLVFRTGAEIVPSGYHLTEVKRVAYETMDCGAQRHRWVETQFEVWTPAASTGSDSGRGHMPAAKFLQIVDRVETELPLDREANARVLASFAGQPAALHEVDAVTARDGRLWVDLTPDRTRCKAAERRAAGTGRGCCGDDAAAQVETPAEAASCGCGTTQREAAGAAVCCG